MIFFTPFYFIWPRCYWDLYMHLFPFLSRIFGQNTNSFPVAGRENHFWIAISKVSLFNQVSQVKRVDRIFTPGHTWYLSRTPRTYSCKFFLAGVNFYRFNAKNWHCWQILREKVAFFTDFTRKIGICKCKFYSPKILPV